MSNQGEKAKQRERECVDGVAKQKNKKKKTCPRIWTRRMEEVKVPNPSEDGIKVTLHGHQHLDVLVEILVGVIEPLGTVLVEHRQLPIHSPEFRQPACIQFVRFIQGIFEEKEEGFIRCQKMSRWEKKKEKRNLHRFLLFKDQVLVLST